MNPSNLVTLRVWGDFACFTRPEMKVERVSYPVMTPSAARGILEAVFWEPQMYYLIDSIRVVKRGQWISIRRNEVANTNLPNLTWDRIFTTGNIEPTGRSLDVAIEGDGFFQIQLPDGATTAYTRGFPRPR